MAKGNLDPQVQALLQKMQEQGLPPVQTLTPIQARENKNPIFLELGRPPEAVAHVQDLTIPTPAGGIPIRIYRLKGNGPFPILLYFHGGG